MRDKCDEKITMCKDQPSERRTFASVLQIKAKFGPRKIPGGWPPSIADCNAYFEFLLIIDFPKNHVSGAHGARSAERLWDLSSRSYPEHSQP